MAAQKVFLMNEHTVVYKESMHTGRTPTQHGLARLKRAGHSAIHAN